MGLGASNAEVGSGQSAASVGNAPQLRRSLRRSTRRRGWCTETGHWPSLSTFRRLVQRFRIVHDAHAFSSQRDDVEVGRGPAKVNGCSPSTSTPARGPTWVPDSLVGISISNFINISSLTTSVHRWIIQCCTLSAFPIIDWFLPVFIDSTTDPL